MAHRIPKTTAFALNSNPPSIAITSPANFSVAIPGPATFTGTASSPSRVSFAEMAIDGAFQNYLPGTINAGGSCNSQILTSATWSISYNIPAGIHFVVVRETDNEQRQSWTSITVPATPGSNNIETTTQSTNGTTSSLTVMMQDLNGSTLTAPYLGLTQNGNLVGTAFAPHIFVVKNGAQYYLGVSDYPLFVFNHWKDTNSTDRCRAITITQDTQVVAVYNEPPTGNAPAIALQASVPQTSRNHNWVLTLNAANSLKNMTVIPTSSTSIAMYDAVNGPLGMNLLDAMFGADMSGHYWSSLTDGQKIRLLKHFQELLHL